MPPGFPSDMHDAQLQTKYMDSYDDVVSSFTKTFQERSKKYGAAPQYFLGRNGFKQMIWIKVVRAFRTKSFEARLDSLLDLINYVIFWIIWERERAENG